MRKGLILNCVNVINKASGWRATRRAWYKDVYSSNARDCLVWFRTSIFVFVCWWCARVVLKQMVSYPPVDARSSQTRVCCFD